MTASAFSNTLLYDGREKQTLADGIYKFRCGYQDDENGEVKISPRWKLIQSIHLK